MKLIYLASPYNHVSIEIRQSRFEAVRDVTAKLMNQGKIVYSPIVHNHPIAIAHDLPRDFDYWSKFDFVMLSKCDGLLILCIDGWQESVGIKAETNRAVELGLPIYYIDIDGNEIPQENQLISFNKVHIRTAIHWQIDVIAELAELDNLPPKTLDRLSAILVVLRRCYTAAPDMPTANPNDV